MSNYEAEYGDTEVDGHVRNMERARHRARETGQKGPAIRAHCVECCGGVLADVASCPATECCLYPWRMGTDAATHAKRQAKDRLRRAKEKQA